MSFIVGDYGNIGSVQLGTIGQGHAMSGTIEAHPKSASKSDWFFDWSIVATPHLILRNY